MRMAGSLAQSLGDPRLKHELAEWRGSTVHGVAGIGNPGRFFAYLREQGLTVVEHAFPDHHGFRADDLAFGDDRPVLMTAKDAVKCRRFAREHHHVVTVQARPAQGFVDALDHKLKEFTRG